MRVGIGKGEMLVDEIWYFSYEGPGSTPPNVHHTVVAFSELDTVIIDGVEEYKFTVRSEDSYFVAFGVMVEYIYPDPSTGSFSMSIWYKRNDHWYLGWRCTFENAWRKRRELFVCMSPAIDPVHIHCWIDDIDDDADGWADCDGDCDDYKAHTYPYAPEICDGIDNDCDGVPDDGYECIYNQKRKCYTGPPETEGVLPCRPGTQYCQLDCTWGSCNGEVTPQPESCDLLDNDCDGKIDEDFDLDRDGIPTCFGDCNDFNPYIPSDEVCHDGVDNNCDGVIDERCEEKTEGPEKDECGTKGVGEPVNVITGEALYSHTDFDIKSPKFDFQLMRFYSSKVYYTGPFGFGWTHNYNIFLKVLDDGRVVVSWKDGRFLYFTPDGSGGYIPPRGSHYEFSVNRGGYELRDGALLYEFNSEGRLTSIMDEDGIFLIFEYEDGQLKRIKNSLSNSKLEFEYDAESPFLISRIYYCLWRPAPPRRGGCSYAYAEGGRYDCYLVAKYSYEDLNLVSFTVGMGITDFAEVYYRGYYLYDDPYDVHNLTSVQDENGKDLFTFSYSHDPNFPAFENVTQHCIDGVCFEYTYYGGGTRVTNLSTGESSFIEFDPEYHVTTLIMGECYCGGSVVSLWDTEDGRLMRKAFVNKNFSTTVYSESDENGYPQRVTEGCSSEFVPLGEIGWTLEIDCSSSEARTLYYKYHPFLKNTQIEIKRDSVLVSEGWKRTIFDYDNPASAEGHPDIPNEAPASRLYRVIEEGYTMDEFGNVVPYRYITTYKYNDWGQLVEIDGPLPADEVRFSYYDTYPYKGLLREIIYPNGDYTRFEEYNTFGSPSLIKTPNYEQKIKRDSLSKILRQEMVSDSNSRVTEYSYDTTGRLISVKLPGGVELMYGYEGMKVKYITRMYSGHPVESIVYYYDEAGNGIREEFRVGGVDGEIKRFQDMKYDTKGNPTEVFNSLTSPTPDVYNPSNPIYTEFSYDEERNLISKSFQVDDWISGQANYTYDLLSRLKEVKKSSSYLSPIFTQYTYDMQDNLTSIKDGRGNTSTYLYDDMGRLVKAISPDSGETRYAYDSAGNLVFKIDAKGNVFRYTYDSLNRLKNLFVNDNLRFEYHYDNERPIPEEEISYGMGRLTGVLDHLTGVASVYSYNGFGEIVRQVDKVDSNLYRALYTYYPDGGIESITYPSGKIVRYIRSSEGKVGEVRAGNLVLAKDVKYEPFGDVRYIQFGNGLTQGIDYTYSGEAKRIYAQGLFDLHYSYDYAGGITAIEDRTSFRSDYFWYDGFGRLGGYYTPNLGDIEDFGYHYEYDNSHNRTILYSYKGTQEKETSYNYESNSNRMVSYNDPLRAWFWAPNVGGSVQAIYERFINDMKRYAFDICGSGFGKNKKIKEVSVLEVMLNVNALFKSSGFSQNGITRGKLFRLLLKDSSTRDNLSRIIDIFENKVFQMIDDEFCTVFKGFIKSSQSLNIFKLIEEGTDVHHDENGNVIRVGDEMYEYDEFNRLTKASVAGIVMGRYSYNIRNQRVKKEAFGSEILYIYDIFGNLISEYEGSSGDLIRDYVYLGNRPLGVVRFIPPSGEPSTPSRVSGCVYVGSEGILGIVSIFVFGFLGIFAIMKYGNRWRGIICFVIAGICVIILVMKGSAQTGEDMVYYFYNDHLRTPRALVKR